MKRIATFALALIFVLNIAGCGEFFPPDIFVPDNQNHYQDPIPPEPPEPPIPPDPPEPPEPELPPVIDLGDVLTAEMLYSRGVFFYNVTRDYLVFAKNENESMPPASTLKIMTALITLENVDDFTQSVEVPSVCFAEFDNGNPNNEGIALSGLDMFQDNLTYLDCLYALMMVSGNDASNVLAYNAGGGNIRTFIDMMNMKAYELGAENTNFDNAHGLHTPKNYSSARDMFLITRYVYEKFPFFTELTTSLHYTMPANSRYSDGYSIRSGNIFGNREGNIYYTEYAEGVKTGSLDYVYDVIGGVWVEVGGVTSLVSRAFFNDELYIAVTLCAPYFYGPYNDEDGNMIAARMHYTFLDHKLLYETAFG